MKRGRIDFSKVPSFEAVKRCACEAVGISVCTFNKKLKSKANTKTALARQLWTVYYISNTDQTQFPLTELTETIGYTNHAMAHHHRRSFVNMLKIKDKKLIEAKSKFLDNIKKEGSHYSLEMNPEIRKNRVKFD